MGADALRADVVRHDVFAFLWASASAFHVASFPGWRWDHPIGVAYAAFTVWVLLRPGSLVALGGMVLADLAGLASSSPKYPNHILDCSDRDVLRLRDERYAITYFQLRVLRTRAKRRFTATFDRGGETFEFDSARPQTAAVLPPVPWIAAKLCQFRPVGLGEKLRARH